MDPEQYAAHAHLAQQQLSYQQAQQQQQQQINQLEHQIRLFWTNQHHEIQMNCDFKNHSLPLARIKKIMKADEDVRMIAAEAPVLFAKACEMFILELTLRSWAHTEEGKRRTLQKNDIAAAITRTNAFDFLVDIVPREEYKEEGVQTMPGCAGGFHPYYDPARDHTMYYTQQQSAYMQQQLWTGQQQVVSLQQPEFQHQQELQQQPLEPEPKPEDLD